MSSFTIQSSAPIAITNNTPASADNVWVTVYGSLITNPGNNQTPAPGVTYYLVPPAEGQTQVVPTAVNDLPPPGPASPDGVILPSYTLAQWGSNLSLPAPSYTGDANGNNNQQYTGRILISVGAPTQAQSAAKLKNGKHLVRCLTRREAFVSNQALVIPGKACVFDAMSINWEKRAWNFVDREVRKYAARINSKRQCPVVDYREKFYPG